MGSGVWIKNIKKKLKGEKSRRKRFFASQNKNGCTGDLCLTNGDSQGNLTIENAAATRIQTAYRAYAARRSLRRIKGTKRLQNLVQHDSVKNQASNALNRLHSWTKTQAQIKARRANMVLEGKLRQKKLEHQLKLEAKLHDFEVEWNSGSETVTEALAKIHHREEAAVRRERAMAYAFTHQWRAQTIPSFGSSNQELSKANWGWSWMDRWIAARPWESRVESPKKLQPKKAVKTIISPTSKARRVKSNSISPNEVEVKPISPSEVKVELVSSDEVKVKPVSPNGAKVKPVSPDEVKVKPISSNGVKVKLISPDKPKVKSISPNGAKVKSISPNEVKVKSISPKGKVSRRARKLSYEAGAVKKTGMKSEAKKTKTVKKKALEFVENSMS